MCTHPILIMQMMGYICGFWVGRPIWYTSGFQLGEDNVRRAIFTTKNPHGAHMGPICVGILVGSGWEGPSGIHLFFIWATWAPYTCGFLVGRPI